MKFSDIPGQEETIQKLISSVKSSRVSHALLFTGPEGCGNLALALAYAQYISCENRTPSDACGVCKSCVKHEKMIHPDLHFVFPVVKKPRDSNEPVSDFYLTQWREFVVKSPYFSLNNWLGHIEAGNAQGLIYSAESSEIMRKLSLKSFESDFKIMIIWLPEKMHLTAANKLLKLIEEPPQNTILILVSDEPDKVIPTIISRCQMIKIPLFRNDEISFYLVNTMKLDETRANDISWVSNGNIVRAVELSENEEAPLKNLDYFKALMRFAWKKDYVSLINWSEEMASLGREPQKSFLVFSLRLLRENLMLTLDQRNNNLVFLTGEENNFSSNFHPFVNTENIYSFADEINLAYSHIEANGNPRLVFLDMALKITPLIVRDPAKGN